MFRQRAPRHWPFLWLEHSSPIEQVDLEILWEPLHWLIVWRLLRWLDFQKLSVPGWITDPLPAESRPSWQQLAAETLLALVKLDIDAFMSPCSLLCTRTHQPFSEMLIHSAPETTTPNIKSSGFERHQPGFFSREEFPRSLITLSKISLFLWERSTNSPSSADFEESTQTKYSGEMPDCSSEGNCGCPPSSVQTEKVDGLVLGETYCCRFSEFIKVPLW